MRKKINHPYLIWILAVLSLGINLLVLFSAREILANNSQSDLKGNSVKKSSGISLSVTPSPSVVVENKSTSNSGNNGNDSGNSKSKNDELSSTNISESNDKSDQTMAPSFSFDDIPNKDNLSGDVKIRGTVDGASGVEFYLLKKGSISPELYVGKGSSSDNKTWTATLFSKDFPDGEYKLFAKIKNIYGSYKSEEISLIIKNLLITEDKNTSSQTTEKSISTGTNDKNNANNTTKTNVSTNTDNKNNASNTTKINDATSADNNKDNANKTTETSDVASKKTEVLSNTPAQQIKSLNIKEEQIKNDPTLSTEEKTKQLEEIAIKKQEIKNNFVSRQEAERILVKDISQMTMAEKDKLAKISQQFKEDADGDGLPDFEEERLGTDIFSADSDGDGFLDGDEVKNGFNPLLASAGDKSDKIIFEEPKEKGTVSPVYEVKKVSYKKGATTDKETGISKDAVILEGKALPNSFVTLYIYSSGPIVVTVKADENGNWQYSLDKELEEGEHQVFATVTDNTGKITAKSEAFSFIKTAQAVESVGEKKVNDKFIQNNASPLERTQVRIAKFVLIFSFISLLLAVTSIVLFIRHREFFQKKIDTLKQDE